MAELVVGGSTRSSSSRVVDIKVLLSQEAKRSYDSDAFYTDERLCYLAKGTKEKRI